MNNYCTLFDSGFLSRGLNLHKSLIKYSPNSTLYIFAFDVLSHEALLKMELRNARIISLQEFEDADLLRVKPFRSKGEYCWTSTPSVLKYCFENFNLEQCTYIDADLCFYSDPAVLIEEIGSDSVLITEHRYTEKYDQTKTSGKYCVQFITFKNSKDGMTVLNWWRERCLEWCYARHEDGKFGDQKYLDDWKSRFTGVKELEHLGGGVAPWNLQQYTFNQVGENVELLEKSTGIQYPLVFFHFHALRIYKNKIDLGNYELSADAIKLIYVPYITSLEDLEPSLANKGLDFNWHAMGEEDYSFKSKLRKLKRKVFGTYNIIWTKREMHG